jgi:hypothetical protein
LGQNSHSAASPLVFPQKWMSIDMICRSWHLKTERQFLQMTWFGDDMQSASRSQGRQCDVRQTAMVFEIPGWPPGTSSNHPQAKNWSLSSVGTWKKTSSLLFLLGGQQGPWQSWYDAAGVELTSNQMEIKQSSSQSSHRAFCDKPKLLGVVPPLLFGQESSFFSACSDILAVSFSAC